MMRAHRQSGLRNRPLGFQMLCLQGRDFRGFRGFRGRGRGRGFTLVEMIASLALTAILMVGLLGVIRSTASAGAAERAGAGLGDRQVADRVVDLLRHDLAHATTARSEPNELAVEGLCGLDRNDRTPTHRPAQVTYTVAPIGGRSWLVRTQRDLDDLTTQNTHRQLVLANVATFEVANPSGDNDERRGQTTVVPDRVRVRLTLVNGDRPLIDRTLLLSPKVTDARGHTVPPKPEAAR